MDGRLAVRRLVLISSGFLFNVRQTSGASGPITFASRRPETGPLRSQREPHLLPWWILIPLGETLHSGPRAISAGWSFFRLSACSVRPLRYFTRTDHFHESTKFSVRPIPVPPSRNDRIRSRIPPCTELSSLGPHACDPHVPFYSAQSNHR